MEIAKRVEKVAEEAIAFVSEEARARGEQIAEAFPGAPKIELKVDTLAYDVSVIALGVFGATLMLLSNLVVGGAPAQHPREHGARRELKKRAMEEAPKAVEEAARQLADAFCKQIDELGDKLVDFVKTASEEMTRSIAEVVRHARDAKAEGAERTSVVKEEAAMSLGRLAAVEHRMSTMRTSLWANGSGTPPA
jgi:gas vesicle protein